MIKSPYAVVVGIFLLFFSCKKEERLDEGKIVNLKSQSAVIYNAEHDVLVFSSFESIRQFHIAIEEAEDNYVFDQGNKQTLLDELDLILSNGYTNGVGIGNGNSGEVDINALKSEMQSSYPLSDEVLQKTLDVNNQITNGLPQPFLRDIFIENAPFSRAIQENIVTAEIPEGIKNQILNADDNAVLTKNHVYEDFLNQFPAFNSLWEKRQQEEYEKLTSGMDPADSDFTVDFLTIEFDQLIFNDKHELYVEGYLYKIFSDCKMAVLQGTLEHCYGELAMLNEDGFVAPPLESAEPIEGIPTAEMALSFPLEYALVNPDYYSPEFNNIENYNSLNQGNCPQAEFSYIPFLNDDEQLVVVFDNYTDLNYERLFPVLDIW